MFIELVKRLAPKALWLILFILLFPVSLLWFAKKPLEGGWNFSKSRKGRHVPLLQRTSLK